MYMYKNVNVYIRHSTHIETGSKVLVCTVMYKV